MGFSEEMDDAKRFCSDCKTTKTPLWRSGPDGPKSLCNACGIRFRKKKSPTVSSRKDPEKKKEKPSTSSTTCSSASSPPGVSGGGGNGGNLMSEDLRVRLMAFGKEVVLWQRQRSPLKRQRTTSSSSSSQKLGEEEQAAVLLMDLSCGSVFA